MKDILRGGVNAKVIQAEDIANEIDVYSSSAIKKIMQRNIITAIGTATGVTAEGTKVSLMSKSKLGDKLSIEDGGIKIGIGVTAILISGKVTWSSKAASTKAVIFEKNTTQLDRSVYNVDTPNQPTIGIPNKLEEVQRGDIIYLKCSDGSGGNVSGALTYVTVEVVA